MIKMMQVEYFDDNTGLSLAALLEASRKGNAEAMVQHARELVSAIETLLREGQKAAVMLPSHGIVFLPSFLFSFFLFFIYFIFGISTISFLFLFLFFFFFSFLLSYVILVTFVPAKIGN